MRRLTGALLRRYAHVSAESSASSCGLESEIRSTARRYAQKHIAPLAASIDEQGSIPFSIWKSLGEMGMLGVTASPTHGGLGLGHVTHVAVMEEISRASASVGLSYAAHSNLCVNQLVRHGTSAQCDRWLPALVSGSSIGALAMSETAAGSDVLSMRTRAQWDAQTSHFVLNGSKMWITNGPAADVVIVYAKTGDVNDRRDVTAFVLEKGTPGFTAAQKLDKLGMRGSETCELVFENVRVPKENVLGEIGGGVRVLMSGLDSERALLAAGPLGIMRACMDVTLPYVREREQFGQPVGNFQLMQGKVADMFAVTNATAAFVADVARKIDEGGNVRKECAAVILFAAEHATQMALQTVQALGGNGYVNEYPAGRLLRDAKLYEIGAGTSEIRRMLIGRELMKEDDIANEV